MHIKQEEIDPLSPTTTSEHSSSPSSSDDTFSPPAHHHAHAHFHHLQHQYQHHHQNMPVNYHHLPTSSSSRVKRLRANDRERRRVHLINCAMEELREVVPGLKEKRRLTKLELLRAANQYIWLLDEALRTNRSVEQIKQHVEEPHPITPMYYVTYEMPKLKREPSM